MPELYCVRADYGTFAPHFVKGGYAAIGWIGGQSLGGVQGRHHITPLFKAANPSIKSNIVIGQQVGQIARFLLDLKVGDYVITPDADTEWLHYGVVEGKPSYF